MNHSAKKITTKLIESIVKKRNPDTHKGTYGHAIIMAGSYGKMGAAILAAKSCLRSGVGLLTMYVPKCGYDILQISVPEAMVICDENKNVITQTTYFEKYNALGIGCGIGTSIETIKAVKQIIKNFKKPIVIDADAINIIAKNKGWLKYIAADSIFTPHAIEFERLIGKSYKEEDQHKMQLEFSKQHNVYVVLKSHHTTISCPNGNSYSNSTGNAGMAKAGNGDALTGIITALLTQKYSSENACVLGVYLHGLAGDIAVKETGDYSLLATDLINNIGKAFLTINNSL